MADLSYLFPIKAPRKQVFDAISTPAGLNSWWTKTCSGEPVTNNEYELGFGPNYDWRGRVLLCMPDSDFELQLFVADQDWQDTRLVFHLSEKDGVTEVDFHHLSWPTENEHFRISCYCWAMYLRLLKRYVELGEVVPYDDRLEV